jgi:hypothetical protein
VARPADEPVQLSAWLLLEWQETSSIVAPEEHDDREWSDLDKVPPLAHELVRTALVDAMRSQFD